MAGRGKSFGNVTSSPSLCHPLYRSDRALPENGPLFGRQAAFWHETRSFSTQARPCPQENPRSALSDTAQSALPRARTRFGGQKTRVCPHGASPPPTVLAEWQAQAARNRRIRKSPPTAVELSEKQPGLLQTTPFKSRHEEGAKLPNSTISCHNGRASPLTKIDVNLRSPNIEPNFPRPEASGGAPSNGRGFPKRQRNLARQVGPTYVSIYYRQQGYAFFGRLAPRILHHPPSPRPVIDALTVARRAQKRAARTSSRKAQKTRLTFDDDCVKDGALPWRLWQDGALHSHMRGHTTAHCTPESRTAHARAIRRHHGLSFEVRRQDGRHV